MPIIVCSIALLAVCGAMVELSRRAEISAAIADFNSYDARDGRSEALADIRRGEPKWKVLGRYTHFDEDSARLKRLGITVDYFAGCAVSRAIVRYDYTYNATVYGHYVALVGPEITEDVLGSPPQDPFAGESGSTTEPEPTAMNRLLPHMTPAMHGDPEGGPR